MKQLLFHFFWGGVVKSLKELLNLGKNIAGKCIPLKAVSSRRAHATNRGFQYQHWLTVLAWLRMSDEDLLVVEGREDFDLITRGFAKIFQVKDYSKELKLSHRPAAVCVGNFLSARADNAGVDLTYTYMTTASLGVEPDHNLLTGPNGIHVWNKLHELDDVQGDYLHDRSEIRALIQRPLDDYEKSKIKDVDRTALDRLKKHLSRISEKKFQETIIKKFFWAMNLGDVNEIESQVEESLREIAVDMNVFPDLIAQTRFELYHMVVSASSGVNDGKLTKQDLDAVFSKGLIFQRSLIDHYARQVKDIDRNPTGQMICHDFKLPDVVWGRGNDIQMLNTWLGSDQNVLVINAIGGMGKTTLARYWVEKVEQFAKRDIPIFWWSFYEQEANFKAFLAHIYKWIEGDGLSINNEAEALAILQKLLNNHEVLIVLDGFEREVDPSSKRCMDGLCRAFISWVNLTENKAKILITTRTTPQELLPVSEGTKYKLLNGFSEDDVISYFSYIGVKGEKEELLSLSLQTGRHPLAIKLLGQFLLTHRTPELRDNDGMTENILLRILEVLPEEENHILELIAACSGDVQINIIQNAIEVDEGFDRMLGTLENAGLIAVLNEQTVSMHPILRNLIYDKVEDKKNIHAKLIANWLPARTAFEQLERVYHLSRSGQYIEAYEAYRLCEANLFYKKAQYVELLFALEGFRSDKNLRVNTGSPMIDGFIMSTISNCQARLCQFDRSLEVLEAVDVVDQEHGNLMSQIMTRFNKIERYLVMGELITAKRLIDSIHDRLGFYMDNPTIQEQRDEVIYRLNSYSLKLKGYLGEDDAFDHFVPGLNSATSESGASMILSYGAITAMLSDQFEFALILAQKSFEIAVSQENFRGEARALIALLIVKVQQQEDPLEELLEEALNTLAKVRSFNQTEFEIECLLQIGWIHSKLENWNECKEIALLVMEKSIETGMLLVRIEAHILLALCYASEDNFDAYEFHLEKVQNLSDFGEGYFYVKAHTWIEGLGDN
ncbi:NB-ARC domain-containing protein [Terasakiella sp.]|uniref:NB-ARC domain-containing protein n=1 Tax=Terasakiella sp. TaxID=2034861 RepID=UPI003AA973F0